MTECSFETSVPDWVIDHLEAVAVFQRLGMNDSCAGKSLSFMCRVQGMREEDVLAKLHEVISGGIQSAYPLLFH